MTTKPLCPFCSKPWSDEMVRVLHLYASEGCSTCGHGSEISGVVDITCDGCNRLIYRKEFKEER